MYWRPGPNSGARARHRHHSTKGNRANAIQDAARFVRYVRFSENRDTRRTTSVDVYDILTDFDDARTARFAGAYLDQATRDALGRPSWVTLWRIARAVRRGH